ncbi:sugar phosphate isomerase/epimerase [Pseudonocardia nematodicida]|uniref:Sugar phosphate isomerase/epimerase n=1 Tax=Pseudonocardia nematodicida TaxID=1206997 RepID=A0ABV1KFH3_9PSEU
MTLSVQLYSAREAFTADPSDTLRRIAELGYTRVEPYGLITHAPVLREALPAHGLTAPTAHQTFLGDDVAPVLAAAREAGVGTVIDPHVPQERWQHADDVAATAALINDAARVAADHGVRIGYHNHAHELASTIGGTTALEYFADRLDDAVVLEVDTYWAAVGGTDPVALLRRLGERVVAVHVKDGPATPETLDQVAVGQGSLPIPDILAAAPQALRVVELDATRGDMFTALADSYSYLTGQVPA